MDLSVVPYQHHSESPTEHHEDAHLSSDSTAAEKSSKVGLGSIVVKYKECMRNHAASIGGHANDGCGEFMPRGLDNTSKSSLICAACGCHRNFHRREVPGADQQRHHLVHSPPAATPMLMYNAGSITPRRNKTVFNTMPLSSSHNFFASHYHNRFGGGDVAAGTGDSREGDRSDDDRRSETPERGGEVNVGSGGGGTAARNKRVRTKFTQEQKDRMLEFAESIGWRVQKQDGVALDQFCSEVGIKRNVLKVWMHNNKNSHRRREAAAAQPDSHGRAPPPPSAPPQPAGV